MLFKNDVFVIRDYFIGKIPKFHNNKNQNRPAEPKNNKIRNYSADTKGLRKTNFSLRQKNPKMKILLKTKKTLLITMMGEGGLFIKMIMVGNLKVIKGLT